MNEEKFILKNCEKKEDSTAEITVEVSAQEFETALNKSYNKNKSQIALPGFRKGKAPRALIEKMYGSDAFYPDAFEFLYDPALKFAAEKEDLKIVGTPSVMDEEVTEEKTVILKFNVGLYPVVEVVNYKGLKADKAAVVVTPEEIDAQIESVRTRNARIEAVDRPAQNGDTVNIDFKGLLEGKPFDGGTAEGFDLELGSGSFVPGFEEQLIGAVAGDERNLDITFPENYAEELAGKAVVFEVKVNSVSEKILPELDDEFVKDVTDDCETMEDYRASVSEKLVKSKEAEVQNAFRSAVIDKLAEENEVVIPGTMVDARLDYDVQNFEYQISQFGMTFESYCQAMGKTAGEFRNDMRPNSEKNLKVELLLAKIAEIEKIEVPAEDIEAEYEKLAAQYNGMKVEDVKKYVSEDSIRDQLAIDKATDFVVANAEAVAL